MSNNIYNIKNRFLQFVTQNKLIEKDDKIVVGLSGGPDSICLLSLLNEIKEEMNITIAAAHINHMIRGKEADSDEEYAKNICEKMNISFFSKRVDVLKLAKERKMSSEAAGRKVRYDFFDYVMKTNNMNKIATAHNANDQAETVLMRLMRGTGLEGLGGILAKRDNIIRPIIFLEREEVERYCLEKKLDPHIDKTNLERIYSRNKIRLDILPYMKENFNSDIVESVYRMSLLLQDDNRFIESQAQKYYSQNVKENGNEVIISKDAFLLDKALITRIIRRAINYILGNKYNLEMKHIFEIMNLQKGITGKKVNIPGNIYAINVYGDISIKKENANLKSAQDIIIKKNELTNKCVKFGSYNIKFEIVSRKNVFFDKNDLIKYFDYNNIKDSVTIRTRRNGDKIVPFGMKGNKKVKDIFIDMKIPKEQRDTIPIVEFDNDIAWIVSVKFSDKFKVTESTSKILKITIDSEV